MENLKNKKIALIGLGEENYTLAKFFVKKNIHFTCDRKSREELIEKMDIFNADQIEFLGGEKYLEGLKDFDIIFRTPGLPYLHEKIQEAKMAGVEISSQIKLFFNECPSPIIGITGTKGKGTTATLIGNILKESSKKVYLGGNIGKAPIEFMDELTKNDIVVLELSSFQLQDLKKSPHIAVVLDIKIDHLDYHSGRNEYIEAKKMIVEHQTGKDFAVINADYLTSFEFGIAGPSQTYFFSRRKSVDLGTFVGDGKIILRIKEKDIEIIQISDIQLRGEHNLENICAAITASYLSGANIDSIQKAVKEFKGLEHRLELVGEIRGVKYYNDSFSTTPDTTIAALRSFNEPIILLLGGSEKNADYDQLKNVINNSNIKLIISIGETAKKIVPNIGEIKTMDEAIKIVTDKAKEGDVVLLSPASASFDQFKNYKERGKIFKDKVINAH